MHISSPPINNIVFYSMSGDDSMAVIRVLGPAKQLGLRVIKGVKDSKAQVDFVHDGDIIILQRDFPLDLDAHEQILSLARTLHKPVILDLDDLLFELPENHPDRLRFHFTDALLPMLQAAMEVDLITVATTALRDYLLPYNQNIVVIPNYLNDNLWHFREPSDSVLTDDIVTIGYMGGHSHRPDLMMVLPALLNIVEKYPQKVRYQFWGIEPPIELAPFSRVDWCPPTSLDYADFVSYFLTQSADIVIAPLCDNLFNSCKSSIKYLEYSAFGAPGVYSRVNPYSDIIIDGRDGFLASSMGEWESSLSKLIEDRELRITIAQNAQQKVKQHWLLSQNAKKQLQVYLDTTINYSKFEHSSPPIHRTVKSLSHQFHEEQQHRKIQIAEMNKAIESLTDQLAEYNSTIEALADKSAEDNRTIKSLTDELVEHKNTIGSLTEELAEHKNTIRSLTDELAEHKNTIGSLTDELAEHKNTIGSLTHELTEDKNTIKSLTDQFAAHKNTIKSLTDQSAVDSNTIASLTDQLAEYNRKNQLLLTQLDERENEALSYAVSKSWRLTRPMRKIARKIKNRKR